MTLKGGMLAPVPLAGSSTRRPFTYPHALVLIQKTAAGTFDEYGQPVEGAVTETAFSGYLVEMSSTKLNQANEAGPTVATHVLKAPPALPITKNDLVRWAAADLRRYEVSGDPHMQGGRLHHQEVSLKLVTPDV